MHNRRRVIAIDGPSGAGKSTVSKAVAERMGFHYLDTGSLYRAVGLYLSDRGLSGDEADDLIGQHLKGLEIKYLDGAVAINKQDYTTRLRTPEAGHFASVFSTKKAVRDFLLGIQRGLADTKDIVAEGRDMTTVVFPDAWRKFYLDASLECRAKRRYEQLIQMGKPVTFDDAMKDVKERDHRDRSRELAPLQIADDAIYVDTTNLSTEEVIDRMMGFLKS